MVSGPRCSRRTRTSRSGPCPSATTMRCPRRGRSLSDNAGSQATHRPQLVAPVRNGRTGALPVKQMGKGTGGSRRRGYRILLSDLLAWEARLATTDVDAKISNMLSSRRDREGVSAASKAPRPDAGPTGRPARRTFDNGLPMGTRPRKPRSSTRRQAASVTEAGPQA